jgi:hypothetical protein
MDEAALQAVAGGSVTRVDVTSGWQGEARSNVASLSDVWALAPERGVDQPRPVGRVLRQFYESLLAANRWLAEAALDELRARSLLNATNIRFLRVDLLATLGTPEEMRDDPRLSGISRLARPPAVTERLAIAANDLWIEPALVARGSGSDWQTVAGALEDVWPGLVTHLEQVTTLPTARCLVLGELLAQHPRVALLSEVAERYPDDPVAGMTVTGDACEAAPTQDRTALALFQDGDYLAALEMAEAGPLERSTASVALAAAVNLGDSTSAVRALARVDKLSSDNRKQLLATAVERTFYEQLLARTSSAHLPANWLDWLRNDWTDRPDLLAEWAHQWPKTPQDLDRDAGHLAEELIDALSDHRRGRVRNGLPVFVDWLVLDGLSPSGVALATTVFDILLSSEPGRIERQASLVLLEEVLVVGCTSREYSELIESASRQLALLGPRDAPWLSQCVDLLLLFTSYDRVRRDAFSSEAAGVARSWWERLEPSEQAVLQLVLADAGFTFSEAGSGKELEVEVGTGRSFRSVGIYSLLETASRVASEWIRKLFPQVERIEVSSEHVNSQSLSALVRSSDVMLVQTSHAKHAATRAIEAASLDPTRLVLVHGRGATALVRALLTWANGESLA